MIGGYDAALFRAADAYMSRGGGPSGTYETTVERDEGDPSGELAAYDVEVQFDEGAAADEARITRVCAGSLRVGQRVKLTEKEKSDFAEAFALQVDEERAS